MLYTYDQDLPSEAEATELNIYVDEEQVIHIGEEKATAFQSGETFIIRAPSFEVRGCIETDPSQGNWMGHISKANRAFQRKAASHVAYDWKIGWRTLRREENAFAKLRFSLLPLV